MKLDNKRKVFSYTGNSTSLTNLGIDLCGLEEGVGRFLKRIKVD